jgi:adenylate cyclase
VHRDERSFIVTARLSLVESIAGYPLMNFPTPSNEADRVAALQSYGILDSAPEIVFDDVSELAAQICKCPVAYIGFMDDDRLWLKAKYGLPPDFQQCPREIAFCRTTICGVEMVIAPDVTLDKRFRDLPLVTGEPHFRFYCGMPLITEEGHALGTLCVMDFEPRELSFEQLDALRRLSRQLLTQLALRRLLADVDQARLELAAEKARADALLTNMLPDRIAAELKREGKVAPRYITMATIMFADIKSFTLLTERMAPAQLIDLLDQYFSMFDEIIGRHSLEKVKTVGDAYMAVAGVLEPNRLHAIDACLAALEMQAAIQRMKSQRDKSRLPALEARIGLHSGPVISGVIGKRRITFDIWGDAVNTAALMEANGAPGRVNISDGVAGQVSELFELEPRGGIDAKHKGTLKMHYLNRLRSEYARDPEGRVPNERFAAERNRILTGYAG